MQLPAYIDVVFYCGRCSTLLSFSSTLTISLLNTTLEDDELFLLPPDLSPFTLLVILTTANISTKKNIEKKKKGKEEKR